MHDGCLNYVIIDILKSKLSEMCSAGVLLVMVVAGGHGSIITMMASTTTLIDIEILYII